MRTLKSLLLLSVAAMIFVPGTAAGQAAFRGLVDRLADDIEDRVIEWRRDLHEHPELSNREFRTSALVAEHLRTLGLEVSTGIAHTGVIGILHGGHPGPVVALRADMDGLPVTERVDVPFASKVRDVYNDQDVGVMHACGHDTHVAMLMGVASTLSRMKDDLRGTVKFIFQPAEEGAPNGEGGGAEMMVEEGVLTDPEVDVIFGLHIDAARDVGKIGYRPGGIMASVDDFQIIVHGKQTHGSRPWGGVDPIVTAAQIINGLQTIVSRQMPLTKNAAVVTIGSIHGGVRSNIIPEKLVMLGTIRALDEEMRQTIHERIRRTAVKSAGARAEVTIPYSSSYPITYNDPDLVRQMLPSLHETAGEKNVELIDALTIAEDFSYFAREVPGLFYFLGGKPLSVSASEAAPHHTPDFFVDESGMKLGVRTLSNLALDYMEMASRQ